MLAWNTLIRPAKGFLNNLFNIIKELLVVLISALFLAMVLQSEGQNLYGYLIVGTMITVYIVEVLQTLVEASLSGIEWLRTCRKNAELAKCKPYVPDEIDQSSVHSGEIVPRISFQEGDTKVPKESLNDSSDEINWSRRGLSRSPTKHRTHTTIVQSSTRPST